MLIWQFNFGVNSSHRIGSAARAAPWIPLLLQDD
jgi:hypothetical protein